jgi:hypothetical protein
MDPMPTSSPGGRGGSGRVNPRASSFFWLSPHTGPWEVSPRGGRHPPGGGPHPGERTPAPAHSSGFPHTLDRGRYLHGGRGRRGGGMRPLPCLFVSRNTPLRIPNVRWQRALPTVPGHDGDEKFEYGCNNLISRSEDNMETLPVKK